MAFHTTIPPATVIRLREETLPAFVENCTVKRPYLTCRDYLRTYEPTVYALLLDPETEPFAEEYRIAEKVAMERGERGLRFPGEKLPLFRDCVWAEVYIRQR